MDQVSRPTLIALVGVILFAGIWFTALRPKPETAEEIPLPAPVEAVDKAKSTAATADAAVAKSENSTAEAATSASGSAPSSATAPSTSSSTPAGSSSAAAADKAIPAGADEGERIVLTELAEGKTVVLLFWDKRGADDREVKRAVRSISTRGGKVRVHVTPISHVAKFEHITRGVTVVQSPTTLVIAPDRTARAIVGLTEPSEVNQAVGDALAAKR